MAIYVEYFGAYKTVKVNDNIYQLQCGIPQILKDERDIEFFVGDSVSYRISSKKVPIPRFTGVPEINKDVIFPKKEKIKIPTKLEMKNKIIPVKRTQNIKEELSEHRLKAKELNESVKK